MDQSVFPVHDDWAASAHMNAEAYAEAYKSARAASQAFAYASAFMCADAAQSSGTGNTLWSMSLSAGAFLR